MPAYPDYRCNDCGKELPVTDNVKKAAAFMEYFCVDNVWIDKHSKVDLYCKECGDARWNDDYYQK